jgi:hypothetical protein
VVRKKRYELLGFGHQSYGVGLEYGSWYF